MEWEIWSRDHSEFVPRFVHKEKHLVGRNGLSDSERRGKYTLSLVVASRVISELLLIRALGIQYSRVNITVRGSSRNAILVYTEVDGDLEWRRLRVVELCWIIQNIMTVTNFVLICTFIQLSVTVCQGSHEMSCAEKFIENGVVPDVIYVAPREKATVRWTYPLCLSIAHSVVYVPHMSPCIAGGVSQRKSGMRQCAYTNDSTYLSPYIYTKFLK